MPSPNEAKLEKLREEALSMDDGYKAVCLAFINRAFQLGRMEQHERDKEAIERIPKISESLDLECLCSKNIEETGCEYSKAQGFNEAKDDFLQALASVSPVEGEE